MKREKYLLAIDAGTGSIRAVIFDTKGNQIAVAQKEWSHLEEEGVLNSMNFDYEKNWTLVCQSIKEALNAAKINAADILALSATSMREGIVLYDKEGKELWAVANVDARASQEVRYLQEHYKGLEEEFYKLSGQTFALGALPRLLWLKNNRPEIYEKVSKISMISDWIVAKLSGVISSDPSNGGTSGIFSLSKRSWVSEMAAKVGLKDDIFPEVLEVGTVMGNVTVKAAKETNLSQQTLVVMGGGDVQLGAAGLGVVEVGDVAVLGGSFWQQVVNISSQTQPLEDMNVRINPHVIKGVSQAEGITFFSGLVMRWFRDAFCELEKMEAKKYGCDVYEILEQKASRVPAGSYGIMPIFSDVMKYSKWYHAAPSFLNLNLNAAECNRAAMFRSLEENAAIVSSINLQNIEKFSNIKIKSIVFAGGASKGALWSQILSDVTGYEVKIPKVREATALGAAMAAGVGCGIYENLSNAAKELVVWEKTYTPNVANTKVYETLKIKWQKAYEAQLKLVDDNITTSMWKAPGL
ncbi:autoinducer-2 kinase [Sulfurimonas sp.]